jgi:predicted DNA-binding protein
MTMTKRNESLPRPVHELEALAAYYDSHDTSPEMEHGEWVDPRPMKTTSLRLPADVVDTLKTLAQTRGMRYTALVREIIEHALNGVRLAETDEFAQINQRLARIEAAVVGSPEVPTQQSPVRKPPGPKSEATTRASREGVRERGGKVRKEQKLSPKAAGKTGRSVSQ